MASWCITFKVFVNCQDPGYYEEQTSSLVMEGETEEEAKQALSSQWEDEDDSEGLFFDDYSRVTDCEDLVEVGFVGIISVEKVADKA